jgi:hypothetical protein
MKIYIDQTKLKRRALLSHVTSLGGLFVLMAGVVMPLFLPRLSLLSQLLIVVGILVSMSGIYFANRWVRRPRPEDSLAEALKTLGDGYNLYNYTSLPGKHILLMPNGIMALETINLAGEFSYLNGRWKEKMNLGRMLRYLLEEHLGDPTRNARRSVEDLKVQIRNTVGLAKPVPISGTVVFLHPLAQIEVKGAPIPVCKVDKLRKIVVTKAPKLDPEMYDQISTFLEKSTLGEV